MPTMTTSQTRSTFRISLQPFNQKWDGISGSLFAKFTKLRDILADLRSRNANNLAQFLRRSGLDSLFG